MSVSLVSMAMTSEPTGYVKGKAPVATDVTLAAPDKPVTGDKIQVNAIFSDPDGDNESGSLIRWYHDDGSAIAGATGKEYVIRTEDKGKRIQAGYTPATNPDITDPYLGSEVKSALTAVVTAWPDVAQSTFTTDRIYLPATGSDSAVMTLTLKDSAGIPVEGVGDRLSFEHHATKGLDTVKLIKKSDVNGVYGFSVAGTKTGTLQFTPQLDGKTLNTTPATLELSLIPGIPVPDKSTLRVDKKTYTAGDNITVTAILRDANDNLFTGAEAKKAIALAWSGPDSLSWTDNGDGSWTGTAVAKTAGTGYTQSIKFADWATPLQSDTYNIVAGAPAAEKSSLTTDSELYYVGNDISFTLNLKDKYGNPATTEGGKWNLTAENTKRKSTVSWTDNGNSVYTCQSCATASAEGTGLHAYFKLPSMPEEITSKNTYVINQVSKVEFNNVKETAVKNARFTLKASRDSRDYNWSTTSGFITLTHSALEPGAMLVTYSGYVGPETSHQVTVVATPVDVRDKPVTFTWSFKYFQFKPATTAGNYNCPAYGLKNTSLVDLEALRRDWGADVAGNVTSGNTEYWSYKNNDGVNQPTYDFSTGTTGYQHIDRNRPYICNVSR